MYARVFCAVIFLLHAQNVNCVFVFSLFHPGNRGCDVWTIFTPINQGNKRKQLAVDTDQRLVTVDLREHFQKECQIPFFNRRRAKTNTFILWKPSKRQTTGTPLRPRSNTLQLPSTSTPALHNSITLPFATPAQCNSHTMQLPCTMIAAYGNSQKLLQFFSKSKSSFYWWNTGL